MNLLLRFVSNYVDHLVLVHLRLMDIQGNFWVPMNFNCEICGYSPRFWNSTVDRIAKHVKCMFIGTNWHAFLFAKYNDTFIYYIILLRAHNAKLPDGQVLGTSNYSIPNTYSNINCFQLEKPEDGEVSNRSRLVDSGVWSRFSSKFGSPSTVVWGSEWLTMLYPCRDSTILVSKGYDTSLDHNIIEQQDERRLVCYSGVSLGSAVAGTIKMYPK